MTPKNLKNTTNPPQTAKPRLVYVHIRTGRAADFSHDALHPRYSRQRFLSDPKLWQVAGAVFPAVAGDAEIGVRIRRLGDSAGLAAMQGWRGILGRIELRSTLLG